MTAVQLMDFAISNYGPMVLGNPAQTGGSFTVNTAGVQCLNNLMPGGGPSKIFPNDDVVLNGVCSVVPSRWKKNGRLASALWGQAVATWMNAHLFAEYNDLNLDYACTTIPGFIPNSVVTIGDLLAYVSSVLDGNPALSNGQLSQLTSVMGGIIAAFDGCEYACDVPYEGPLPEPAYQIPIRPVVIVAQDNEEEKPIDLIPSGDAKPYLFGNTQPFDIYPNPAREELHVNLERLLGGKASVAIFDVLGKELYRKHIEEIKEPKLLINLEGFSTGLHAVVVEYIDGNGNQRASQLFFITR